MKHLASLGLAATLAFTLAAPAQAAETPTAPSPERCQAIEVVTQAAYGSPLRDNTGAPLVTESAFRKMIANSALNSVQSLLGDKFTGAVLTDRLSNEAIDELKACGLVKKEPAPLFGSSGLEEYIRPLQLAFSS
ncbi:hypothetical protein ACFPVT_00270 [Corynebacterium choanae]|uniref:Uncharacterized protein n=1 Tax=Corynebacterium choanae TaxID=1862358 RepID=A0A3G6J5A3_9CORY|nr:hypothetical protein [Corynebacterium choanae]AZA13146.1 hypothetical protein CCHOA_03680 [Corynebacterium choanae]